MLLRILRRIGRAMIILIAIVVVSFSVIHLAPGDPVEVMAGSSGASDPEIIANLRQEFGLDKPLISQFGIYLRNILSLDFGYSYRQGRPVLSVISERLPATLLLTISSFILSLLLGILLGVLASQKASGFWDRLISTTSLVIFAVPIYWAGLMAVLLFSVQLNLLPAFGMETLGGYKGMARVGDIALHLILPMLTLALFYTAMYARLMRASMLEVQFEDFIKTARAKGAGHGRILFHHALRNAVLPVITTAGLQAGGLIGGAVLVETVFAWPGLGRVAYDAVFQRDYNVLLAIFIVTSAMGLLLNIITDVLYGIVDPRIEAI
jgi:peptide/nickel transport system permease protein